MLIKFVKDILFPVFCVECGKEGSYWCESCLNRREFSPILRCPGCNRENVSLCPACRPAYHLDGISAMMTYEEDGLAARLIHDFKYKYAFDIKKIWESIADQSAKNLFLPEGGVIIPVPLYPRRERERGFNQANIIASILFDTTKKYFPDRKYFYCNNALSRRRETAQQAKLGKQERKDNVKDVFVVNTDSVPETAIVVDDVFTTGATLNECAKVLKEAGTKTVWAVTLARAI